MSETSTASNWPRHVAVIMDGNGRWAKKRFMPRAAGHHAGVKSVRATVEGCARRGVEALTLFAFSSENWKRPAEEVSSLMNLFVQALEREVDVMHRNGIRVRFIGQRSLLSDQLQQGMADAERRTQANTGMQVVIAVAYGGRWDLLQATSRLARQCARGERDAEQLQEADISANLELHDLPDPDLFIRTGGERRISNFLLWNLAYTELYFTDVLWPDFGDAELADAFTYFSERQRRFGLTAEQLEKQSAGKAGSAMREPG